MWIQVRSMDDKKCCRVDGLSRLTKVEELRKKLVDLFDADTENQRLFYRGKQVSLLHLPITVPTRFRAVSHHDTWLLVKFECSGHQVKCGFQTRTESAFRSVSVVVIVSVTMGIGI